MHRITSLHNKTQVVPDTNLPYNPSNKLIQDADLRDLFRRHGLGDIPYNNINLYRNAFVHRSYCTMKNHDFDTGNTRCPEDCLPLQEMSYERLEFLGDAILGYVIAHYLMVRFPDQDEGFLSRLRTKIVNGKMLGQLANKVGFSPFVIMSKQIEEASGRTNYKIMEDVFEAFIGAIMMDFQSYPKDSVTLPDHVKSIDPVFDGAGYYVAQTWIINIIEKYIDFSDLIQAKTNFKDMLVRYMQHTFQDSPRFFEISVETRHNSKVFKYCVKNRAGTTLGTATGASKKEAENNAAHAALQYYGAAVENGYKDK